MAEKVHRGTNLRGISKNGRCNWQILMMNLGANAYLGTVDNIVKAGILYDIFSIQSKGLKAKTNFNYTRKELYHLMKLPSLQIIKEDLLNKLEVIMSKKIILSDE
jgi:hypothetical protein